VSIRSRAAALALALPPLAAGASGCALIEGERHRVEVERQALETRAARLDTRELAAQLAPLAPRPGGGGRGGGGGGEGGPLPAAPADGTTPGSAGAVPAPLEPVEEPLSLERAAALALETSERLRAAGEDLHQAHLLRLEAVSVLLPRVVLRHTYTRQEDDFPEGTQVGGGSAFSRSFLRPETRTTRLDLRQPLVRVGEVLALAAASSVIDQSDARLRAERLVVEQATAAVFYAALEAERRAETFRAAVDRDTERIREIRAREVVGLARRTEVLFVETDLARARSGLAQASEDLASAREQLALLVGRPIRAALVEPVPDDPGAGDLAGRSLLSLVEEAFARRPDLRALRQQVEVEEGALRVAAGGYAPTLDFSGTLYLHREGSLEDVDWDIALELAVPIFEGLETTTRVRQAESRLRQAAFRFQAEARAIAGDVAAAWHALRASGASLDSREAELRAAEENYRLLEAEYRVGLASNLELVAAQQQLTSARLAYETERINEKRLALLLRFLMGMTVSE